MPYTALASTLLLLAAPSDPNAARDVAVFEPVTLGGEVTVTSFGIIEDSRCGDRQFCTGNDRLTVAAVVSYRGTDREVALTLGEPIRLNGGTLTLSRTSTPSSSSGAIRLKKYRFDFLYRPDRGNRQRG